MNTKNIIKTACVTLLTLCATSCLDLEPKASLGDNLVWDNSANFQLFANQFYGYTRDFQRSDNYASALADGPHCDTRSDLLAASQVNTYSQGTNAIPATDANYTRLYKDIYYTNLLLSHAVDFADQDAIAVPVGEALFFRAYLHFELVQMYGDCQLLTAPLDIDAEQLYAQRDDRGVVVDQILADLKDASEKLPETAEAGRATKWAALALRARVALYEGTWQKFHTNGSNATTNTERSTALLTIAKQAANEVISGGAYSLFYDTQLGNQSYRYMFILEDEQCNPAGLTKSANTEYILSTRHRIGDKLALNITHAYLSNAYYPTRKLANMYLCSDGLPIDKSPLFMGYTGVTDEFKNRDNRMTNTLLQHGQQHWNNDGKWRTAWDDTDLTSCLVADVRANSGYQTYKWATERKLDDYYEAYDYPVIRYAEVLLTYAEAAYELDGNISDADLDKSLNLVRQRINTTMPKLSNTLVSSNGLDMRQEIRRERTVELALEGYRIDDLKRWATAVTEMNADLLGVQVTGTWFETNWAAQARGLNADGCIILYSGSQWSDKNYLYPLPSDQTQLNPQLGQNSGWTN